MIRPRAYWTAPVEMLVHDYFNPEPSVMTQLEGTSLSIGEQFRLQDAIMIRDSEARLKASLKAEAVEADKPLGKKLGVYVNGKLRFQSRDSDAIYAYADRRMAEKHSVWVAPVGSFVDA